MAAEIEFEPLTERGRALLDELESWTGVLPFKTNSAGARTYWLADAGEDGFDAVLNRLEPSWHDHLTQTP